MEHHTLITSADQHYFAIRLAILFGKTAVVFLFHRVAEKVIHLSTHKLDMIKRLCGKFSALPDLIMFVVLMVYHGLGGE